MNGWIKLHRKIRDNPVFFNPDLFRLWIICLLEATHKEREQIVGRQVVRLIPGQFVTGRFDLHALYNRGLKPSQQKSSRTVWRLLECLEDGQYLTINSTNKYSVVTIENWAKYQVYGEEDDQQNDQQLTSKWPTNDQQMTTNKNVKKEKNEKEVIYNNIPFAEIIAYLNERTGKNFSPKTKAYVKAISGRWNEGRTLDDFKHVIDVKADQWLGTDMEKYLNPETLFRPSKFDKYLNERRGDRRDAQKGTWTGRSQYGPGSGNEHPATAGRVGRIRSTREPAVNQIRVDIDSDDTIF